MTRTASQHSSPKQPRSPGRPYTPGMFDAILGPPAHSRPEEIAGVSIALVSSGRSVIVAEQLRSGESGVRTVLNGQPISVFMQLADGSEVWIEVQRVVPVAAEDREPWLMVGADEKSALPALPIPPILIPIAAHPVAARPTMRRLSLTRAYAPPS